MAEKSNALTVKEIVLQVDHLLFLVERLAIFLVIIFPKFSCFYFIYFILTTFLCMEASLQRQLVSKSTPNYQHVFVFLLERAATIVLVLYNWATNYWYIAMASLVISATCSACILNFMPWQKFHKNGIPCPNPCSSLMNLCLSMMNLWKDKKRMFLLERLAVIVFVLYPRSATPFADFFCFSCILDLIRSALRLNPNETEQGDGYLFRIERAMAILLKLHCTNRNIFIARVVFVVTNSVYFVDTLETKQKSAFRPKTKKQKSARKQPQQQHSGQNKPKQGKQMQGIISSVSTTHTSKFRETEIEEESAKEENTKWEEGLVEADGQLKEKAESAAGTSKGENNKWEGDSMQEDEDQLKEKPDTEEENRKREDYLLEVDDSWEDLNSLEKLIVGKRNWWKLMKLIVSVR
ncbi:unnamed protein product [Prunus brigantina]